MYHCLFAIQALTMLVTGFWHSRSLEFSVPTNTVHSKRYRNGSCGFPVSTTQQRQRQRAALARPAFPDIAWPRRI